MQPQEITEAVNYIASALQDLINRQSDKSAAMAIQAVCQQKLALINNICNEKIASIHAANAPESPAG